MLACAYPALQQHSRSLYTKSPYMPNEKDPIQTASGVIDVVATIVKAAGDDPKVKEAASNLGTTAVTLTKTINNVLVPLAAINFAFDKARQYFENKFKSDIETATAKIPTEDLIEPKISIAGPAIQGIAFAHEESNLREMFLNLLATSMDRKSAANAHPAFVEVIKQLSGEDASHLQILCKVNFHHAIAEIRRKEKAPPHNYRVLHTHVMSWLNGENGEPKIVEKSTEMIDNWIRLGLVKVEYDTYISSPDAYAWVDSRPEMLEAKKSHASDTIDVDWQRGLLTFTQFGIQFGKAVGLTN